MKDPQPVAILSAGRISTTHPTAVCGPVCQIHPAVNQHASFGAQVGHFFSQLFDTKDWPARWHCGNWSDFHGWLYICSDLLIWASYFAIPILLIRMITKRKDIPFPRIIWLFVAFIILCGTTHLLDAIIFWWPAYRLSALVRFFTGVVSAVTVYALYRVMPLVLSLRSVKELEREIRQRKIVEEKLAASEFLLNEAGRIGRVGGWEYDVLTDKATWSPTVYDIYEVPYDFDIDGPDRFSFFVGPSRQQLIDAIANSYNEGVGWDLELQMITAKGSHIWVQSRGEVFYNDEGKITKLRGVFMDIDRYKINEQALAKSHELLSESHQQLKTFTHILSHNIRNHTSNISLLTDLIDTETLDENNADIFSKITKVSGSLNNTLDKLSEAIVIRETVMPSEMVDFREVLFKTIEIMESEILANGARVRSDFKVENVLFPRLYLESIVMNLISNAIKYKRESEAPDIFLRTYKDNDDRTVMECQDNGLGIDLKLHGSKIFGLYKTFHAHKDAHGVGLFLVKTQVESQGGIISVDSKLDEGSTFKIIF